MNATIIKCGLLTLFIQALSGCSSINQFGYELANSPSAIKCELNSAVPKKHVLLVHLIKSLTKNIKKKEKPS